jgi:hypothetical protein
MPIMARGAWRRGDLPFWSHLRPEHKQKVRSNSYLNGLRIDDCRRIFQSDMPGSKVAALCDAQDADRQELRYLRSQGELKVYSDEELLTVTAEADLLRTPLRH